ncbi:MAG: ECF transporter S component [Lactobacillaceae bacterium]|jgi:riboflavin transporter FmnP|nr:ECF transporter S component [Lactobacillaceae bacterium]
MLSVISFLLMIQPKIPLIPDAPFLTLDLSTVIILLIQAFFGFKNAVIGLTYRSILHLIFLNAGATTLIGLPVNFLASLVFMGVVFLLRKKNIVLQVLAATIALTVAMAITNLLFAIPAYAAFANFDISKVFGTTKYLVYMIVPFNLIEGIVWGISYIFVKKFVAKIPMIKLISTGKD